MLGAKRLIEDSRAMTRRSFLALVGWGGFAIASAIALFQSVRFIFPNATYETPAAVKYGPPSDFAVGSTTVFISDRVVIETGHAATRQNPALPGFKCPCHGSRYFRDSINFFGPAPRPMDHIHVEVAPDGKLLVDRGSFVDLKFRLKV